MTIMEKETNAIGLSREFIIHPGETLEEIIEDRDMSQRELSIRTGVTEKHISTVIHGQKGISTAFAKKLEYALGIEASFWMNLQANYERELLEFEELNNISEQEVELLKNLREVVECWTSFGWLNEGTNPASLILDLRKLLGMSNLLDAPKMSYVAAYRIQANTTVDPYVLFAWQRMCELLVKKTPIVEQIDVEKLRSKIPEIKQVMFMRANQIQKKLSEILAECGIAFRIVPNFKGAPVQGFIKKTEDGSLLLCMTIRQKFMDIFWFTLFHEIAHILNGDTKNTFLDFDSVSNESEHKADELAKSLLIDSKDYNDFITNKMYQTTRGIEMFAESQNIKSYIVLGRLMKENIIPWSARPRYEWA